MSIGLYLVSDNKFEEQLNTSFYSLNEMEAFGYTYSSLKEYFKNWWFELEDIDPNEKVFYLDEKNIFSFGISQDTDPQTISKYIQKKYYYEITITKLEYFYSDFISYLNDYNFSYEIWKIWEDEFDPDNLEYIDIWEITEKDLKEVIGDDTYLYPKVGRVWY